MTRRVSLGIDVSTMELRARALDLDDGAVVAEAASTLPAVVGVDGAREQDADYARIAEDTVARVVTASPMEVVAVSITATSGTLVPVDSEGRQAGPAVMYDDQRGVPFERALGDTAGRPISMLARAMAMARRYDGFRAASVAQVIGSSLVGHAVAGDTSHFLKAGVDPTRTEWPERLLAMSGLDASVFPGLVQPGDELGSIVSGPASGALLIAGMTDGCTSQLAAGGVREGQSVGVLGTTLVLKAVSRDDRRDPKLGLYSHRAPDGRFWVGGASNTGGGLIRLPAGVDFPEMERLARVLGPSGLVSYPLPRPGERFPIADPAFEGFAIRFSAGSPDPADPVTAYRTIIEGVAMVERRGLDALGIDPAAGERLLSGGGTRNRLWNEIRAACLGVTVRVPAHGDSGYGAAVLAAWGWMRGPFADTVERFTSTGSSIDPEPGLVLAMAERYAVFSDALGARIDSRSITTWDKEQ